ncbi:MAG: radical SAM protein [Candidatus Omnitrophica bacterium]|nr:radical SAM protein [Candidatus Omnitrophota bacterium]
MRIKEKVFLGCAYLKTILFGIKKPLLVSWELTKRCNLRCKYCGSWLKQDDEIGPSQALELIRSLYAMGTRVIRFTGGEPLLREDLPRLVNHCSDLGISVGIASNGILFPGMANEFKRLAAVSFSLDGPEDIHDFIRGKGSHKQVMQAIDAAKEKNIYTTISVTLNSRNLFSLDYILGLARELRVQTFFQPALKTMLYSEEINPFKPDITQFRQAMEVLIREKRKNKFIGNSLASLKHMRCWPDKTAINCVAGKIICRIGSNGQMYPCPRAKVEKGELNVLKKSAKECFEGLTQPFCGECWCSLFVDLNLLSRLSPDTIIDALFM